MDGRAMGEREGEKPFGALYTGVGVACFAVLGGLAGRHVRPDVVSIALFAAGCALFALVGLTLLGWLLGLLDPGVRKRHGQGGVSYAVGRGFLMVIPFTVLAATAELYLGWSAVQAFTSSGTMMGGAAVGVEMARLGGGRIRSLAVPMASAFVLSALWMFLSAMALSVGRG